MKRQNICILLFLGIFVMDSCTKNNINSIRSLNKSSDISNQRQVEDRTLATAPTSTQISSMTSSTRIVVSDAKIGNCDSVEIKIWADWIETCSPNACHDSLKVSVDPGFVLVGGGAHITNDYNTDAGVDADLVSAYPVDDGTFTTYAANSADHLDHYSHRLWVYAIGMKWFTCHPKPISVSY